MQKINIKVFKNKKSYLKINKEMALELGFQNYKNAILVFGFANREMDVLIDNNVGCNEICISSKITNELNIPTNCLYDVKVDGNVVEIGPFIGIYLGKRNRNLLRRFHILNSYTWEYEKAKGVLFAFVLDGVSKNNMQIDGYYYNPQKDVWEAKRLPFPGSVYKRAAMGRKSRSYFRSLYGDKVFNDINFNKWEMYEYLNQFDDLVNFFPITERYRDMDQLLEFLDKHKGIYIKPIMGLRGKGIYKAVIKGNDIHVFTRSDGTNSVCIYKKQSDFIKFVNNSLEVNKYIIQKALEIQVGDRSVDFRIGLNKDDTGNWVTSMAVARISARGSIVSNIASGGEVKYISEALKENYNIGEQETILYESDIINLANKVANRLEQTGLNLGVLAFDIAMDGSHNLWLIEINNKSPDDTLANKLDGGKTYQNIRKLNMLYAKSLSG